MRYLRIGIMDFGMAKTHRRINLNYFQLLSKFAKVTIVNSGSYYDELKQCKNVELVEVNMNLKRLGSTHSSKYLDSFEKRLMIFKNMYLNKKYIINPKAKNPDIILIMGYEIITFALFRFLFPRNIPIYLFHHQQIDELQNPIKKFCFNTFKDKVHHIVLEDLFKGYLVKERGVDCKQVNVVHLVISISKVQKSIRDNNECPFVLGISGNNDEELIRKLIEDQKKEGFLSKINKKMLIRSKIYTYKDEYLEVGNRYFSDQDYDELHQKADVILALSPKHFVYRLSGPVHDAIANSKMIISTEIPYIIKYSKEFPGIIKKFSNYAQLKNLLEISEFEYDETKMIKLQSRFSEKAVTRELMRCFLQSQYSK